MPFPVFFRFLLVISCWVLVVLDIDDVTLGVDAFTSTTPTRNSRASTTCRSIPFFGQGAEENTNNDPTLGVDGRVGGWQPQSGRQPGPEYIPPPLSSLQGPGVEQNPQNLAFQAFTSTTNRYGHSGGVANMMSQGGGTGKTQPKHEKENFEYVGHSPGHYSPAPGVGGVSGSMFAGKDREASAASQPPPPSNVPPPPSPPTPKETESRAQEETPAVPTKEYKFRNGVFHIEQSPPPSAPTPTRHNEGAGATPGGFASSVGFGGGIGREGTVTTSTNRYSTVADTLSQGSAQSLAQENQLHHVPWARRAYSNDGGGGGYPLNRNGSPDDAHHISGGGVFGAGGGGPGHTGGIPSVDHRYGLNKGVANMLNSGTAQSQSQQDNYMAKWAGGGQYQQQFQQRQPSGPFSYLEKQRRQSEPEYFNGTASRYGLNSGIGNILSRGTGKVYEGGVSSVFTRGQRRGQDGEQRQQQDPNVPGTPGNTTGGEDLGGIFQVRPKRTQPNNAPEELDGGLDGNDFAHSTRSHRRLW